MMSQIRKDGPAGKTTIMVYGDSISDGFGASDMLKLGYANLLKESVKLVDSGFDTL